MEEQFQTPGWFPEGILPGIQGGTKVLLNQVFALLDEGAAVSGVWCADWSGIRRGLLGVRPSFGWSPDAELYPRLPDAFDVLREHGVRPLISLCPLLLRRDPLYSLYRKQGWLLSRGGGAPCRVRTAGGAAGLIDLTNPEAVEHVQSALLRPLLETLAVSGWLADGSVPLPGGGPPLSLPAGANSWPSLWKRITWEAAPPRDRTDYLIFTREECPGSLPYAPPPWSFRRFPRAGQAEALLIRRLEAAVLRPIPCAAASPDPRSGAGFDAAAVRSQAVRLSHVRRALLPYLTACSPVLSDAGTDGPCFAGRDLYVCPVPHPRASQTKVMLPKGVWVHFWTGKVLAGGDHYTVPSPPGSPPVFYRASSEWAALFRETARQFG